jgi:hypothetical protein
MSAIGSVGLEWYKTGTVTLTQGSQGITGVNTVWKTAGIKAGDMFTVDDTRGYEIASVTSNTQLTLAKPFQGASGNAQNYAIIRNWAATLTAELAASVAELVNKYEAYIDAELKQIIGPKGDPGWNYKSNWAVSRSYNAMDVVTYNSKIYVAIMSHTSTAANAPGAANTAWADLGVSIGTATNTAVGVVKGTASDGGVSVNTDGTMKINIAAGSNYGQSLIWNGTAYIPSPDPAGMITYVSPDGEDNPLAGYNELNPFRTIAYAIARAASYKRDTYKRIRLLPGNYPESITINSDAYAGLFFNIYADALGTVTVGGQAWTDGERTETVMVGNSKCKLTRLAIKPKTGASSGQIVYSVNNAYTVVSACDIDASNAATPMTALYVNTLGVLEIGGNTRIIGGQYCALHAAALGKMLVNAVTLDGNIAFSRAFALASAGGQIHLVSAITNTGTLSGGKRYEVSYNGDISGVSFIPTSSLTDGTVVTGGRAN